MQDEPTPKPLAPLPPLDVVVGVPRRIASTELFSGAREIVIDHDGRVYRMRITQNGKLILTA